MKKKMIFKNYYAEKTFDIFYLASSPGMIISLSTTVT